MIPLGLSAADQRVFEAGLLADHAVSTRVRILDMDQQVVGEVTGGVMSGQVDVDETADVGRTCTLTIRDPGNRLGLASTGPTDPPIVAAAMVQVEYGVRVPALGRWVWVPVFTGPISKADADDDTITITGQGKESWLTSATSRHYEWQRGMRKTDIISQALQANGEQFRQIVRWNAKTTADTVIASTQPVWPILRALARSLTSSSSTYPWLGYDGRGVCVLKSHSQQIRWQFATGDGGSILSRPKIVFDTDRMRNLIVATANGGGSTSKLKPAVARAPKSDPFSPENLARGGVPRFVREDIQGDWTSQQAIQQAADATLADRLHAGVEVSMDTLIVPHLEPRDVVRVVTDRWVWDLQVMKFTIPLGAVQAMSHGRTTVVRPKARMRGRGVLR